MIPRYEDDRSTNGIIQNLIKYIYIQLMQLEDFRRIRLDELATLIQKTYRAWAARWLFLKRKQAQIQIATAWRRYKVTIYNNNDIYISIL